MPVPLDLAQAPPTLAAGTPENPADIRLARLRSFDPQRLIRTGGFVRLSVVRAWLHRGQRSDVIADARQGVEVLRSFASSQRS